MSGGHFDYSNYMIDGMADTIECDLVANQKSEYPWPQAVVERLKRTVVEARKVSKMLKHADYLFSGDDGPETFLEHWAKANEFQSQRRSCNETDRSQRRSRGPGTRCQILP